MVNGMIIDAKDNVGVVIEPVKKGSKIVYLDSNKNVVEVSAVDDFERVSQIVVDPKNIEENQPIVKYGEHIGLAAYTIQQGSHVHVHNVKSAREDLEHREV